MRFTDSGYREVRPRMQPGDVLACSGVGPTSSTIKAVTRSNVSHIALITRHRLAEDDGSPLDGSVVSYLESTSLRGKSGVVEGRVSDLLLDYLGDVYWLPLSESIRAKIDLVRWYEFVYRMRGRSYDFGQAVLAGLDMAWSERQGAFGTEAKEDLAKLFCSELAAAALEYSGAIPPVNASEVTPAELVSWDIYEPTGHRIAAYNVHAKPGLTKAGTVPVEVSRSANRNGSDL